MKKNALKELLGKSHKELHGLVDSLRIEMNKFTVFENTGKEKNTTKASNIRRDIAQILTVIKERQSSKS